MIPFLETARLSLRQFRADDADNLYRLHHDPRVMRYIGDGSVGDGHRLRQCWRARQGSIAITRASDLACGRACGWHFVGWFCLKYVPQTVEIELGYRLLPQAWGYGYATEGASALVRYAFEVLGLYRVIGLTHPGNTASQRVLAESGLARCRVGPLLRSRIAAFRRVARGDRGKERPEGQNGGVARWRESRSVLGVATLHR